MFNKLKTLAAIAASCLALASCDDLRDSYEDCGVWLEFIFDHNMERGDSFGDGMETIDVLVFDADGKFYTSQYSTIDQLEGRKRMFIGDPDWPFGKYEVLTVAGLTDHFHLSDMEGGEFVPGVTTIDEVRHALLYDDANNVNHEFPHLWFGEAVEIDYKANLSVWPVPVIRQTNKFSIAYEHTLTETSDTTVVVRPTRATRATTDTPLHTFHIVAPESGAYDRWNNPIAHDETTYQSHSTVSDRSEITNGEVKTSVAKLNTMRLFADHPEGYTLDIREAQTGGLVMRADLIELLARTKPGNMTLQEYLDRQGEWNIVLQVTTTKEKEIIREPGEVIIITPPNEPDPPIIRSDYIALKIIVNNWILWDSGMGI